MPQPIPTIPQEQYLPLKQEVPVQSDEIVANYLQEERVRNVISQTSPDNQLVEIEWRIKGYRKNPFSQQWEKISEEIIISDKLVARYISYLSSLLNENTRFTNLSSVEINKMMKMIIEWIVDDLDTYAEEYGIGDDYTERTRIGHILINEIFLVLKRAQNGMESRRIFNALSIADNLSQMPQKKGLIDALKFWKA